MHWFITVYKYPVNRSIQYSHLHLLPKCGARISNLLRYQRLLCK